ncbi:MAG: rhodanese-like domain-containing protein [Candidatus Eisenbacteria bacterium]|uniref:Rhodanese-like domain-containing protein n=1 Tax=Eiseniibacteriota bacterium TaxID=2212470 RepID=A0A538UD61_UNCEI|nr:MAG: rhodanese-like domain-containing protein [Candidatus Eisenbacteria bacterium]
MRTHLAVALILLGCAAPARAADSTSVANPAIDMEGYLRVSAGAAAHRASHRVTEAEFIRMSHEPGTVVLDARSRAKYDELHVKGAINLSFPDLTIESLKRVIPDPGTRILIYCNNNFRGAEGPFPRKLITASLNLSTYIALYDYGYRNVYELGPLLDIGTTAIEFESTKR